MDIITNSPGLHHILESIFRYLDKKSILCCREVNMTWKNNLDNRMFWMKMLKFTPWSPINFVLKSYQNNIRQLQLELQRQLHEEPNKEAIQWKFNSTEVRKNLLNKFTKALLKEHYPHAEFAAKYYEQRAFHDAKNLKEYNLALATHLASIFEKSKTKNTELTPKNSEYTERSIAIRRCIQSLVHACNCRGQNCGSPSCHKMKRVVAHTRNCKRKTTSWNYKNEGCPICKQLIALCCYHTKICKADKCPVQFCQTIKGKVKENDRWKMQWKMLSQTFNNVYNPAIEYDFIVALMKLYIVSGPNGTITKSPSDMADVMASSKKFPSLSTAGINLQNYIKEVQNNVDRDTSNYFQIREQVQRDTKIFLGVTDEEPPEKRQKIGL